MDQLKVAVVQMDVQLGQPEINLDKVEKLVRKAAANNPDVVLLPETWNTGFFPENVKQLAGISAKQAIDKMSNLAKELKINIVGGSISDLANDDVINSAKIFNKEGKQIAQYNKIHLFSPGNEKSFYTEGSDLTIFEIEGHKCGIIICYDLRFPELIRRLALEGIEILFVPAEWPHPRLEHWRTLQRARAIENQMFVVSCNGAGEANGMDFCGHSSVIDPWGEIMVEAEESEEILYANLDLSLISQVREKIPVFEDRRYSRYQLF